MTAADAEFLEGFVFDLADALGGKAGECRDDFKRDSRAQARAAGAASREAGTTAEAASEDFKAEIDTGFGSEPVAPGPPRLLTRAALFGAALFGAIRDDDAGEEGLEGVAEGKVGFATGGNFVLGEVDGGTVAAKYGGGFVFGQAAFGLNDSHGGMTGESGCGRASLDADDGGLRDAEGGGAVSDDFARRGEENSGIARRNNRLRRSRMTTRSVFYNAGKCIQAASLCLIWTGSMLGST